MHETPISPEPDDIDKMESLFDEKPASRMVWILPSVLLHVVVLAIWISLPEEEPRIQEDRELVIKSEQAEQLKEFVEDANLQELRLEVSRLQEIKDAMNQIRSEQLTVLKDFEKEMQGTMKGDANAVVKQLQETQNNIIREQKIVIQEMDKLEQLFKTVDPLIQKKDFAGLAPYANQIKDTRQSLKQHQDEALKHMRLLQAQLDNADSILSWLKQPEIVKKWNDFIDIQDRVMELQSASTDQQGQIKYSQERFLQMLAEKGKDYQQNIVKLADADKKAKDDYERMKKEFTEDRARKEKDERDVQNKLQQTENAFNKVKQEQKNLNDQMAKIQNKKDKDNEKREYKDKLNKLNQEANRLKQEINNLGNQKKNIVKLRNESNRRLKQLKEPKLNTANREKLIREMNDSLVALNGKVGDKNKQKESFKNQIEASELSKEILGKVKIYMEAKK